MKKAEEVIEFYLKENGTVSFTKDQKDLIACMMREYAHTYSIQQKEESEEK
jgi:tRNA G46 methylase TrmB